MSLQSMIVLHLSAVERETRRGLDRDDLVDWYLETREADLHSVEEVEYERELIGKVLDKLVKDHYLIEAKGDVQESLPGSMDEAATSETTQTGGGLMKVYYMVHPSVDADTSSSLP